MVDDNFRSDGVPTKVLTGQIDVDGIDD